MTLAYAAIPFALWVYLVLARGGFWRCSEELQAETACAAPAQSWPSIVAVVPARDERELVASTLASLLQQNYPGRLSVVLVDDHSTDGTAEAARHVACAHGTDSRLDIVSAPPLPAEWTGKLWAMKHGVARADHFGGAPDYLWLTDADIGYADDALLQLVTRARAGNFVLTSVMAKLRCESRVERALIPAFVFFFRMLYPFAWVNDPRRSLAAAAGGCMLVRRDALHAAGGIDAIRAELIDDCALARRMKAQGAIWLGSSERVRSLRAYRSFDDVRRTVARSAYCQLRYSPWLLALTAASLSITFIAPPVLAFALTGPAQMVAIATWLLMAFSFRPTLRFFGSSPLWGLALPAIALIYLAFTVDSAIQHRRFRGGMWKGRSQAVQSHAR